MGKRVEDVNTYRVGHPLAQRVLDRAKAARDARRVAYVSIDAAAARTSPSSMPFIGRQGWLRCTRLSVESLETEDHLLFAGNR